MEFDEMKGIDEDVVYRAKFKSSFFRWLHKKDELGNDIKKLQVLEYRMVELTEALPDFQSDWADIPHVYEED